MSASELGSVVSAMWLTKQPKHANGGQAKMKSNGDKPIDAKIDAKSGKTSDTTSDVTSMPTSTPTSTPTYDHGDHTNDHAPAHDPFTGSFTLCDCCGKLPNYGWVISFRNVAVTEYIGPNAFIQSAIPVLVLTNGRRLESWQVTRAENGLPKESIN